MTKAVRTVRKLHHKNGIHGRPIWTSADPVVLVSWLWSAVNGFHPRVRDEL
jgi:hypothetical protein